MTGITDDSLPPIVILLNKMYDKMKGVSWVVLERDAVLVGDLDEGVQNLRV